MRHITNEYGLLQAQEAGVGALRRGKIAWKAVEPVRTEPLTYRWEALEALQQELISAAQTGIEVTLLVMFTPDIRHNLQPDEAICVSPQFWANPLLFYQPSLEPYVVGGSSIDVNHLECATQQAPGLWYLPRCPHR
jgi:hypothetical protein